MTDDELFEEFADALEEAGIVDYGSLFKNLRADLARTKSDLFQSGGNAQKSAGRSLNDLIKFIDGDLLDSTQSVELIETVARAKDWDTTNFLPYFGDPESALGKVGNMWDQNMGSTEIAGVPRSTSYNDLARNILTDALVQRTRNNGVQIVKLLQRPEGVVLKSLQTLSCSMPYNRSWLVFALKDRLLQTRLCNRLSIT